MQDPIEVPFPRRVGAASWLLMLSGALTGLAGLQVLTFAALPNAISWAPWVMLGIGAGVIPTGVACMRAEPGAVLRGLLLGGAGLIVSGGLALYLLLQTVVSPLSWLAPLSAFLSLAFLADSLGPVRRYAAAQAQLRAEAIAEAEARAADPLFIPPPPPTTGAGALIGLAAASLAAGLIALAVIAPDRLWRIGLQAEVLSGGRWPSSAAGFVSTRDDYPYPWSPLERYASYEAQFVELDAAAITRFADGIAEEVGWQMLNRTGAADVHAAEIAMWAAGDAKQIPLWIAAALRDRGAFYREESLLSRSFDPWRHAGAAELHLDCDQLTHLFAHVASRLDLAIHEVAAPMHMYLQYAPPAGLPQRESAPPLWIEATNFRKIEIQSRRGQTTGVDYMGEGVGDDFFIDADYHPSGKGGTYSSKAMAAAAGFYQPVDARYLEDSVVVNVMAGLEHNHIDAPIVDQLAARLDGTRHYLLVSNLHGIYVREAETALLTLLRPASDDADRQKSGLAAARAATDLQSRFGMLVIHGEPQGRLLEAEILAKLGAFPGEIMLAVKPALAWYAENAYASDPPSAVSPQHVRLLLVEARAWSASDRLRDPATAAKSGCAEVFGAIFQYGEWRRRGMPAQAEVCAALQAVPACAQRYAPACAE